jgi:isoleucyl-tRNA synthetase
MSTKYTEGKTLDLPKQAEETRALWNANSIFEKSIEAREGNPPFVFFEGPPSANGMPGIHHVMGRSIKDIFCRYKTLKGFQVKRKAGWDTHGLPIELKVEKELGITKKDIGTTISVEDYNKACRETVMRYTDVWNDLTEKMGYWVDMQDPYITYENKYIETVWWLVNEAYKKDLLYKGYTIQPYSPKAGTGLSSAEINMEGAYQDVKDTTVVAQFKVRDDHKGKLLALAEGLDAAADYHFMAWTTTPWTLPSNTALCVGPKIDYVLARSFNQYTGLAIHVVLAKALVEYQFSGKFVKAESEDDLAAYTHGDKKIPYLVTAEFIGKDLLGIAYEQLMPYVQPPYDAENAFKIIAGDFVTTTDGTGIVHIAPTFGADDALVAKAAGVPPMTIKDEFDYERPLVDLEGRFVAQMGDMAGKYVKNEYYADGEAPERSADVELAIKLKEENKAFKVEKYEHSYPHCWRTNKPVLYYPLDSWFVKTPKIKDRLIELNNTINWKPKHTGSGRFGKWLENVNDWNLSRSRYWGIPIPIWRTEEGDKEVCIGSVEQLQAECLKAVEAGVMDANPLADFVAGDMSKANYDLFDLHKNKMDEIILVADDGRPMKREADLLDVWFDSGSMPYAQWHYPFENKEQIDEGKFFPADFIAEGVDQTRGWFFTLHTIATMVFDSVAYKNVVSNGLVLDKNGVKMSKSLGNTVDPFETLEKYGADATRWYMISNASPWENLKFNIDGIGEVQRKFFGTLHNTHQFFSVYANIDGFTYSEDEIPVQDRPELDRWIISQLNSLIRDVDGFYGDYEPTKAARAIQDFTSDHLSNWFVRLSRRRFWRGDYTPDKVAAYQTLYRCLEVIAQLASPIAPFYMDWLFTDLNRVSGRNTTESVHLSDFPVANEAYINTYMEKSMGMAQQMTSMVLGLRRKESLKVRQPLQKLMVPVLSDEFESQLNSVKDLILGEVNIKELEILRDTTGMITKRIKADFKVLGKKLGKQMKVVAGAIAQFSQEDIATIERDGTYTLKIEEGEVVLGLSDVEISSDDIPGWLVATENGITVALDINLSEELRQEGIARELVNRIQNLRKDRGFEVTDRITLEIQSNDSLDAAINNNLNYICSETLAGSLDLVATISEEGNFSIDISDDVSTIVAIEKLN